MSVSIPFKRESVFKADWCSDTAVLGIAIVSIPFKRESVFKADPVHKQDMPFIAATAKNI